MGLGVVVVAVIATTAAGRLPDGGDEGLGAVALAPTGAVPPDAGGSGAGAGGRLAPVTDAPLAYTRDGLPADCRVSPVDDAGGAPTASDVLVLTALGTDDRVAGLALVDPGSGEARWTWRPPAGGVGAWTALEDGDVVVAGQGWMTRLDRATAAERWITRGVPAGARLTAHGDHVTLLSHPRVDGNRLVVVDAATGAVRHETEVSGATFAVVDDVLVVQSQFDQALRAEDPVTGQVLWRGPNRGWVDLARPVEPGRQADALVVLRSEARVLARVDPTTGETLWRTALPPWDRSARRGGTLLDQPVLLDGHVLLEDVDSVVALYDLADGRELLRVDGGPGLDVVSAEPLVLQHGERLYRVAPPGSPPG